MPARFLIAILALGLHSAASRADDPCDAFKWDVAHERGLFAQTPQPLASAATAEGAVQLLPEHLYELALLPQTQLRLQAPLGRKAQFPEAFAGFVRLRTANAGVYRISLDQPGWIDVIGPAGVLASSDFAGAAGCKAPHKLVQFNLAAGDYVLQLSGVGTPAVRLSVTGAPPSGTSGPG